MNKNLIKIDYYSNVKFLLLNFGGIGDEILFFPVIEALREHFPLSKIITVVEPRCREVMENNYYVDKVYTLDIKGRTKVIDYLKFLYQIKLEAPDIIISSGRSPLVSILLFLIGGKYRIAYDASFTTFLLTHKVKLNTDQYVAKMLFDLLKPLGIEAELPLPNFYVPNIAKEWAEYWLKKHNIDLNEGYIAIHTGVSELSKQKGIVKTWENEKWLDLIERLIWDGYNVLLLGSKSEENEVNWLVEKLNNKVLSACNVTKDINQLAALIMYSTLLICVDSAPMHIAVALKKPFVSIFGPTDETRLLPPKYLRFSAVRLDIECRPCLFEKRKRTCESLNCLVDLSVNTVYNAIKDHLYQVITEKNKTEEY